MSDRQMLCIYIAEIEKATGHVYHIDPSDDALPMEIAKATIRWRKVCT